MNFERFYTLIKRNTSSIKRSWIIKPLLRYFWNIRQLNKQKLKLGKITYEFNYFNSNTNIFEESIKIKYVNQDPSNNPTYQFEQLSKVLNKKWTIKQRFLFLIFFLFLFVLLYISLLNWYGAVFNPLSEQIFFSNILRLGLESIFSYSPSSPTLNFNNYLFDMVFQLCQNFCFFI